MSEFDCSVAIVGSGFGGAVSALRLAERGHDVVVLEAGRRLAPEDLLAARRRIGSYLWQPELGLHGFFWQRVFNDVGIIGASAVGGGSIVWGAVLLEPSEAFFADPAWATLGDWRRELAPHYATAARMLGRVQNAHLGTQDEHLRAAAAAVGAADTFGPVPLAVHFGDGPGVRTPDPFFDGTGPDRVGCRLCGGCLVGCPYGSKNTLDLNYLYLAERAGAQIRPRHRVDSIAPLPGGGYALVSSDPLRPRERREQSVWSWPAGSSGRWSCCSAAGTNSGPSPASRRAWVTGSGRTPRRSPGSWPTTRGSTSWAGPRSPRTSIPTRARTSPRTASAEAHVCCARRSARSWTATIHGGGRSRRPARCSVIPSPSCV